MKNVRKREIKSSQTTFLMRHTHLFRKIIRIFAAIYVPENAKPGT